MIDIYHRFNWYCEYDAAEKVWKSISTTIEKTKLGPNIRPSLKYTLVSEEGDQLDIYAANVERVLAQYIRKKVLILGKLVDLSNEGFGQELGIGSIETFKSS
jgi:hypothetical protein